ncbi:uncharacterized protein METZ01_LOCUS74568 [marine metagenome]|uniref:phosphoglycerate mutase (2,3-diphosphoglycerate-dependent) n=1 Tax=marine metagenome TaxID=408172 RepID=A0A381U0V5_9ZZZZ|tara:strand:+ start:6589 stop:7191 length:603 start_codon:yes stop_codon:yes gene_type:complete
MSYLALVRHGQSDWNKKNLFTGWRDRPLTEQGKKEAKEAAKFLKTMGIEYNYLYTSVLNRAIHTGELIVEILGLKDIIVIKNQALNERDYGSLTGLNKDDAREKWGEEQVHVWRRSYDIAPPSGESLKDTAERVLPYFQKEILPRLHDDENILISAHGNSLRSLIMYIENLKPEEIIKKEIATGEPKIYSFNRGNFQPKR